jgi:hypothetical protein
MSQHSDQKNSLFGNAKGSKAPGVTTPSSSSLSSSTSTQPLKSKTVSLKATKTATTSTGGIVLSPAVKARKIEEAKEESELGMKCLKKSVFQWSPDYLAAAPHFDISGNAYKAAGEFKMARLMFLQSADSHEGANCLAAAAVACVKAGAIAQAMNRNDLYADDLKRSAELYGVNGELDKCAEMTARAGKGLVLGQ